MRTEFNNLKTELLGNNVDASNWSVISNLLNKLDDKITEVEKRMECVKRTNVDSHEILFTNQVKLEESIGYDNVEILQRSVTDINIAMDLNDKEPIENDWYGLFIKVDNEVAFEFFSSWGSITCNKKGKVIEVIGDEYINGERNYLYDIESIDVAEYIKFLDDNHLEFCDEADILAVGFRRKNGEYDRADKRWRDEIYLSITEEEEEVKNESPTELCKTPQTHEFVKDIIAKLKVINVDGETMEYILEQVGMTDQMLRQLIMNNPETDTKDLLQEKMELNNKSVSSYI